MNHCSTYLATIGEDIGPGQMRLRRYTVRNYTGVSISTGERFYSSQIEIKGDRFSAVVPGATTERASVEALQTMLVERLGVASVGMTPC